MSENVRTERSPEGASGRPCKVTAPLPPLLEEIARSVAADLGAHDGQFPRVGVAFSGGVDSSVLAALTARAVGGRRTTLILGVSASLARRERRFAHRQAEQLGLRLVEARTDELLEPRYVANPVNRCYFCKDTLFTVIDDELVNGLGLDVVAYGENADDLRRADRPGGLAARKHRVRQPLAASGATKADVRAIAQAFGLVSATKPAAPCLSSRIPHGVPVTAERLRAVDEAEDAVLAAGFSDCRVRHHGDIARIEVPMTEASLLLQEDLRRALTDAVRGAGFTHVTIDLSGIQSGAFSRQLLTLGERT